MQECINRIITVRLLPYTRASAKLALSLSCQVLLLALLGIRGWAYMVF